ncbi:MAG TPA: protein phosphatase 2C domain-containing protein [Labilithrix sp.]|nr:protein phosphatase 2C domain-containing protein [Labilithrix sp.]
MTLSGRFAAAAGSVTGREHRRAERDGQDGYGLVATDRVVAAIVTDGCSSGRRSEIGARVGAGWLAALVEQRFAEVRDAQDAVRLAGDVTRELLVRLGLLARSLDAAGDVVAARIDESLLFGFLAAVVTAETTIVFGVGDGIVVVDGEITSIDPGPDNAPPYVAYGLLDAAAARAAPRVHFVGPTAEIDTVAVATDGLAPVAPTLATLAGDPRYAVNPSLLRKRLVVLSDGGTFSDDATVAVVRRRPR